ncbi:hypothetical protein ACVIGB_000682 [Bradyrhizobium sp. USDA 4341]
MLPEIPDTSESHHADASQAASTRSAKITLASIALWTALAALIWPHTSFSGADAEKAFEDIERESRAQSPGLAAGCMVDLFSYGRERMKGALARDYPSSRRFYISAAEPAQRYLNSGCPTGPFLAVTALVNEKATIRHGTFPLSSSGGE